MGKLNLYKSNETEFYFIFGYYSLTGKNDNKIDYKTAFKCFKKAYYLGRIDAAYYLGLMYMNGTGVEKDLEEAKKYLNMAAKTFNIKAMLSLGHIYYKENNYSLAEYWYKEAAKFGNSLAMYNLGVMYQTGKASVKNIDLAKYWLSKSANILSLKRMNKSFNN